MTALRAGALSDLPSAASATGCHTSV